jgi:small subunit ribosomal protein S6
MLLREYETIYILRPDLSDDEITEVKERVTNIFSQEEEGHVLHQNIWGKKKLSYEIKKQPKGIFVHLSYLGGPATTNELERNLRLLESVLKYQTIRVAKDVNVERRLAERDAEEQARAIATARKEAEAKEREAALAKAEMDSAPKEAPAIEDSHQEQTKPQAETPAESSKEKE